MITFFVPGIPKPGGSKKAGAVYRKGPDGRPVPVMVNGRVMVTVREDCETSRDWRAVVADCAKRAMEGLPLLTGPLRLDIVFHLLRPKGHFGSKGNLLASADAWPAKIPDTTKLVRSTEDAMRGITWRDDSQVVAQWAVKMYSDKAGADITITEMAERATVAPMTIKAPMLPGME